MTANELSDPFETYVQSVQAQWTTAASATLAPALGYTLSTAPPRVIARDEVGRANREICARSVAAADWFRALAEATSTMSFFTGLRADREWYPPLSTWRHQGDELAQRLQRALAERTDGVRGVIAALDKHCAQHAGLLTQRAEHAKLEAALQAQLDDLAPLLDAAERWPPLIEWKQRAHAAIDLARRHLAAHAAEIAADLRALQVLRAAHVDLVKDHLATTTRLAAEVAKWEGHCAGWSNAQARHARDHSRARWDAFVQGMRGLGIGLLAGGFCGCSYGCSESGISAGEGLWVGALIAAAVGFMIGVVVAQPALQRHGAQTESARLNGLAAASSLAEAKQQLDRHRALTPVTAPRT